MMMSCKDHCENNLSKLTTINDLCMPSFMHTQPMDVRLVHHLYEGIYNTIATYVQTILYTVYTFFILMPTSNIDPQNLL